jgi:hypothetical protein
MSWEKMSTRSKLCIGCAVCSAAIFVVMVPIGVFVIGPFVAQKILDQTIIAVPNMTQAACPQHYTLLYNDVKIQVPSILGIHLPATTLESYTQETFTTACEKAGMIQSGADCGENATEYQMGNYTSPEMKVYSGVNHDNMAVVMNSSSATIMSAWVLPLWLGGQKTRLILKAKDIKVKVLGIRFGGLTMRNELTCRGVAGQTSITIPSSTCYPNDPKKHQPYETNTYHAICEAGAHSLTATTATDVASTMMASAAAKAATFLG